MKIQNLFTILFLIIFSSCKFDFANKEVLPYVYLTFEEESTSKSITVNFMTNGVSKSTKVYFDESSPTKTGQPYNFSVDSRIEFIDDVEKTYHHAKLDNLKPATTYYFRIGDEEFGLTKEYHFRTLPNDYSPIKMVVGGDMSADVKVVETAAGAMALEPDVIVVGGDIAYANGKDESKWVKWFEQMNDVMFTPSGRLVPMILAIGNHETTIGAAIPGNKVPFFFTLFPQNAERKSYFLKHLGAHTAMLVLDTGHAVRHSKQRDFIEQSLRRNWIKKHRLAVYHAPLYPNYRGYFDWWAMMGRNFWLPLFDRYDLSAAFEHHDHSLKRTKILRNNEVSQKGVVYFGDGCWGKNARGANEKWYLEKSSEDTHVWFTTIYKDHMEMKAMGKDNEIYDHVKLEQTPIRTNVEEI